MPKYSKKSEDMVESAMHRMKKGTLKSSSGDKVTNPKQAIAIGLSEAREKGAKVPKVPGNAPAKKQTTTSRKRTTKTAAKDKE